MVLFGAVQDVLNRTGIPACTPAFSTSQGYHVRSQSVGKIWRVVTVFERL